MTQQSGILLGMFSDLPEEEEVALLADLTKVVQKYRLARIPFEDVRAKVIRFNPEDLLVVTGEDLNQEEVDDLRAQMEEVTPPGTKMLVSNFQIAISGIPPEDLALLRGHIDAVLDEVRPSDAQQDAIESLRQTAIRWTELHRATDPDFPSFRVFIEEDLSNGDEQWTVRLMAENQEERTFDAMQSLAAAADLHERALVSYREAKAQWEASGIFDAVKVLG